MKNIDILVNALLNQKDRRKKSIKIPTHRFIVEVRTDTDEFIDFSKIPIDANEIRVRKNAFNTNLLYFIKDNTDKYNCVFIIDSFCTYEFITKLKDFFEIEQISLGCSKTFQKVKMGFTVSDGTKEENNVRS